MLRHAGIYTLANLINAAVPFLLLPVLTNYLSPAEYGIVAMFQVLMNGLLPFMGFSLDAAISRQYFDRHETDFPRYVSNALLLLALSSVLVSILFLMPGAFIEKYSDFPREWLWSVLLFAFCQKLAEVILSVWRVQNKAIEFGVFRILRTGLDMALSIYFVIVLKRSWEGRIEGQVVAAAFFALMALFYLYRGGYLKTGLRKEYLRSVMQFGLPLVPHVLGGIIITYSDRIFITNMVGVTEMGLYSVGYQIGMVIYLFQNSFNQAWQPWLYDKIKQDKEKDKANIVRYTYLYVIGILLLAIAMSIAAPFIVGLMTGDSYSGAIPFIAWIAFGFAFNGMYKMFVNYLFYFRKTRLIGMMTISVAVLNIILNYFLISLNGAIGAAQASAISFLLQFMVVAVIANRTYPLKWINFRAE